MDTCIERRVHADPEELFRLAAAVEDWPRILPHYRWVRVLTSDGERSRTVEMAARRDVIATIGFPLHWVAVQRVYPLETRIEFEHIAGISRGMRVTWTMERANATDKTIIVRIRHIFRPRWPVPDAVLHAIVGEYFVNGVARRTLRHLGRLAQGPY